MAQSLRLESAGRSPALRALASRSNKLRHGAKSGPSDQDLAHRTSVNLFVVGPLDEVAKLVASLWPGLATPIVFRRRGEPLRLPTSPQAGTFVIYGVETLTREEQDALHRWLRSGNGRARVVSSASEPLFPLVESGAFNDGLYYHLNVVTIDLTSLRS